jgi:protein tyrosine/serine phosphatase
MGSQRILTPRLNQVRGIVYRAAMPQALKDLAYYASFGIRRIVNLQGRILERSQVRREREWCETAGMEFVHYPMNLLLPPGAAKLRDVINLLRLDMKPTLVHCHDGVDRTGVVCAALKYSHGESIGSVIGDMLDYGFHINRYFYWLPLIVRNLKRV